MKKQKTKKKQSITLATRKRLKKILHIHLRVGLVVFIVWLNVCLWLVPFLNARASSQGYHWYYEEKSFISILNGARTSNGRPALTRSACLTNAARAWSETLAVLNEQDHSPSDHIDKYCGNLGGSGSGEIVQQGTTSTNAKEAYDIFYNSPWHSYIMHASIYDYAGVGYFYDTAHKKVWITVIFIDCFDGCNYPTVTAQPSDPETNNAACLDFTGENPSTVGTGKSFYTEINIRNTGGKTWFGDQYVARSKNPDGNTTWGKSSLPIGPGVAAYKLSPGMQGWFGASFTAPTTPGTYEFAWQAQTIAGASFGPICSKSITVTGPSSGPSTGSSKKPNTNSGSTPAPEETTAPTETIETKAAENNSETSDTTSTDDQPIILPENTARKNTQTSDQSLPQKLGQLQLPVKIAVAFGSIIPPVLLFVPATRRAIAVFSHLLLKH